MAVELATAYISLVPSAKGIGASIAKEVGGPATAVGKQAGEDMGKQMSKGAAPGIASIATAIGGVAAVKGAFDFVGGAVSDASDLNETVSKARTIFGPAADDLEKWASTAATSMGQSKQQALDAAASFGNLFVQLGIGSDEARTMSQDMTALASDFASFHNADITEVLTAQQAAFRGEYDALQRFVPTINAAAVEQEALAATGKKAAKELTLQEKALAVQALMMKGAGDATGDFARTSDSLANKQRIQAAQWADIKAKIGNGVLPVITKLTGFISSTLLPAVVSLAKFVGENKTLFVALGIGITAALVPAFIAWAAAAIPAAAATVLAAAPVIALGLAIGGLAYLVIKHWGTIKSVVKAGVDFVSGLVTGLVDIFKRIPGWIGAAVRGLADIITRPYKTAFNLIAKMWNSTVGKLSFKAPKWIPGIGGKGFDVPDIPTFHNGAFPVPGRPGSDVIARVQAGETIIPAGVAPGGVHMPMEFKIENQDPYTIADLIGRQVGWRLSAAGVR